MTEEKLFWFNCPSCGALGRIDEEQQTGKVSIICDQCGWHGYNSSTSSIPKEEK